MVNILIVVGIIVGVLLFIVFPIGLFIWFKVRGKKKFPFILYSRDGSKRTTLNAHVVIDPTNKSNKMFAFDTLDTRLDIKNPSVVVNGVGHREITFNQHGEYVYLEPLRMDSIDDVEHLKVSLQPEEKQIALHRLKENQRRFDSQVSKTQAYMMLAGFMLILIIVLGVVYSTIAYVNASKDMVKLAKSSTEITEATRVVAQSNELVAEQLASIAAALTGDANITRRIS